MTAPKRKRARKRARNGPRPAYPSDALAAREASGRAVVSITLAVECRAALDAYAAREGLSRSAAVARLVTEHAG